MRYLDPKNDIAFKKIFGVHKDLCISLLNALLPLEEENSIVSIEYVDSTVLPENPLKKNSAVDVRCKDNEGREFLVAMQLYWSESFKQRILYSVTKAYSSQLVRGEYYHELKPVYALCIINDFFEKDFLYKDKYLYTYTFRDAESNLSIKDLCIVLVELPKFKPENRAHAKMKNLWLSFLKDIKEGTEKDDVDMRLYENDLTKKALNTLEEMSFSEKERHEYEKMWDDIARQRSYIYDKDKEYDERLKKQVAEHTAKIEEELREKVRAEVYAERVLEEKKETVRRFYSLGLDIEQIAQGTELSREEVNAILQKI